MICFRKICLMLKHQVLGYIILNELMEKKQQETCEGRSTICVDGLVKGVDLQLSHWTNNETPDHLYADLSTEIALKFAAGEGASDPRWADAVVVNNHYDTDGVLSVFALLHPQVLIRFTSEFSGATVQLQFAASRTSIMTGCLVVGTCLRFDYVRKKRYAFLLYSIMPRRAQYRIKDIDNGFLTEAIKFYMNYIPLIYLFNASA